MTSPEEKCSLEFWRFIKQTCFCNLIPRTLYENIGENSLARI